MSSNFQQESFHWLKDRIAGHPVAVKIKLNLTNPDHFVVVEMLGFPTEEARDTYIESSLAGVWTDEALRDLARKPDSE